MLAFRELNEAFRLTERGSTLLSDCRQAKNMQHPTLALLRQGVYGRLAGYEGVNPGAPGLIKIGAKVNRHAEYVTFQMAEVAVPRDLFAAILERIQRFGLPPLLRRG